MATWKFSETKTNNNIEISINPVNNKKHFINKWEVFVYEIPPSNDISIQLKSPKDTLIWKQIIPAFSTVGTWMISDFSSPLEMNLNEEIVFSVSDPGSGATIVANLYGYTQ
jgi:hypothetical protein